VAQRRRASDDIRDWLYTVVGLGSLAGYLWVAGGQANPIVVACLCALAGRPIWSGLGDVIGRNLGKRGDDDGA